MYPIIFLLQIDLERPLEDQGPFAVILHKLTEFIARNDQEVSCVFCEQYYLVKIEKQKLELRQLTIISLI